MAPNGRETMDIGLRAILKPEVDEQASREMRDEIAEDLEEIESIRPGAGPSSLGGGMTETGAAEAMGIDMDSRGPDGGIMGRMDRQRNQGEGPDNPFAGGMMEELGIMGSSGALGGAVSAGTLSTVALGGAVAFGMFSTLRGIENRLAQSSPALQQTHQMFGEAMNLFFRPFGHALASWMRPMAKDLMDMAKTWNRFYGREGSLEGAGSEGAQAAFGTDDTPGFDPRFEDRAEGVGTDIGSRIAGLAGDAPLAALSPAYYPFAAVDTLTNGSAMPSPGDVTGIPGGMAGGFFGGEASRMAPGHGAMENLTASGVADTMTDKQRSQMIAGRSPASVLNETQRGVQDRWARASALQENRTTEQEAGMTRQQADNIIRLLERLSENGTTAPELTAVLSDEMAARSASNGHRRNQSSRNPMTGG